MRFPGLITLTLFFTLNAVYSSAQGYEIKGKFKGVRDTFCYLGFYYGESPRIKDSVRADKDGNFVFKGDKPLDKGIYLIIPPGKKKWFEILVDKGQSFSVETDTTAEMVEHVKVKGSEDNVLFYKYMHYLIGKQKGAEPLRKRLAKLKSDTLAAVTTKKDSINLLQDKITAVDKDIEKYKNDFMKEHPGTFLSLIFRAQTEVPIPETPTLPNGRKDSTFPYRFYKAHYWDNIPLNDDRILRTPIFHHKLKYYFDKVVFQAPDSIMREIDWMVEKTGDNKEMFKYIVWYTTRTYENSQIMGMDAVFVYLGNRFYKTWKAFWVDSATNQKIMYRVRTLQPLLLGQQAPPLVMQDTAGKTNSLYEVKSKYTVLVFWDPDCGHCKTTIPKLNKVYESKLKTRGVTVYSVNIEDDLVKWKEFIKENKLQWIHAHDNFKQYFLRELYDIYSTPVIYLLDENKRIRAKRIDAEQLDSFIDHLEKQRK